MWPTTCSLVHFKASMDFTIDVKKFVSTKKKIKRANKGITFVQNGAVFVILTYEFLN